MIVILMIEIKHQNRIIMIHSVMFKVKVYLSFVSHVKSQTVNKKGSPYIFHSNTRWILTYWINKVALPRSGCLERWKGKPCWMEPPLHNMLLGSKAKKTNYRASEFSGPPLLQSAPFWTLKLPDPKLSLISHISKSLAEW